MGIKRVGTHGFDLIPLDKEFCNNITMFYNTYHPVLSGQGSGSINVTFDGYFTNIPDSTTVLLRRTKNNQPAMIYPHTKLAA
jgi:hypothetical protein